MLYISFLACTKVEIICNALNRENFEVPQMTLILIQQCPILNLSELLSYTTMYSSLTIFFVLSYGAKTQTDTHTHRLGGVLY